ncbi:cupin domain-containing protein [Caenimonas koreensis]|nr:cupin domain-containing protein [Caenimonas koreensis]
MSQKGDSLDPDIAQALNAAQRATSSAGDDAAVERVRSRLMQNIAADSASHHTFVPAGQGPWRNFLPGIQRKVLQEQAGVMSYLLKFAPGAVLPAHRHPVDEECVVLEGTLRIGDHLLPPGSFHAVRKDVLDCDSSSDEGCVIYLRGASPRSEQLV